MGLAGVKRADVLIVGQGLAGTLLAWELERAGIDFAIADQGQANAASLAAAGIINPVTGRRLVKTWRIETLLPRARLTYQQFGDALGLPVWRELRVRRLFADEGERAAWARKRGTGELAPFVTAAADEQGFWIEQAARVDLGALLGAARKRWMAQGRLQERRAEPALETLHHAWVIDCTGHQGVRSAGAPRVAPWEFSKGEVLQLQLDDLDPGVVLNRRHWVMPAGAGAAWVGATHEPGVTDATPTESGRNVLERSAAEILGRPFRVTGHRAGVRVTVVDKLPVSGPIGTVPGLGVINALGGKGALWAPLLAAEWATFIRAGAAMDPLLDVNRFAG